MEKSEIKATSVSGICQLYGLGPTMVREAIKKGDLPAVKVGRRVVIRIVDVEQWIGKSTPRKPAASGMAAA